MSARKIVVLGTGGTIAGAGAGTASLGYKAAQFGIGELLAGIPSLAGLDVEHEQVAQIDSKDMDFAVWQQLVRRCHHWLGRPEVQGLVITHGTDTIEETAYFLQAVLAPAKPVVLTCAMRPATALAPDGPQNIVDAVSVASTAGAHGVVVVCAGTVHGAADVTKVHPLRLDAFSSGDAGPIGYVEGGALRLVRDWPAARVEHGQPAIEKVADVDRWPRVEILLSHAGADGALVKALLAQGVQGLVVAATGNGTLHHKLEAALLQAQAQGVKVLRTTRCTQGRIMALEGDTLPAHPASAVKARIDLLLELLA